MRLISVAFFGVLLTACVSQFDTAQNAAIACNNANPYAAYVNQNILADADSATKYKLLSSPEKLNQNQKDTFLKYLTYASSCRKTFMANMGAGAYQNAYASHYNRLDQMYSNLLSGDITIGQANTIKAQSFEQLQNSFQRINQQTADANARAYQQYLDNQQKQQAINSQIINSIQRNQPTQTYCNKDGAGNMSCTTY